jgi:hypothetical protein
MAGVAAASLCGAPPAGSVRPAGAFTGLAGLRAAFFAGIAFAVWRAGVADVCGAGLSLSVPVPLYMLVSVSVLVSVLESVPVSVLVSVLVSVYVPVSVLVSVFESAGGWGLRVGLTMQV